MLNFQKWNKSNFRIKYLNILNIYENDIKTRINSSINNLKNEKDYLKKEIGITIHLKNKIIIEQDKKIRGQDKN